MAQPPHAADVHVNASLVPIADCKVGQEVVWPVVGDVGVWRITEASADGVVARCQQSKDILIFCPGRLVPVVTSKQQPTWQHGFYQSTGTSTGTFGSSFGNAFGSFTS